MILVVESGEHRNAGFIVSKDALPSDLDEFTCRLINTLPTVLEKKLNRILDCTLHLDLDGVLGSICDAMRHNIFVADVSDLREVEFESTREPDLLTVLAKAQEKEPFLRGVPRAGQYYSTESKPQEDSRLVCTN